MMKTNKGIAGVLLASAILNVSTIGLAADNTQINVKSPITHNQNVKDKNIQTENSLVPSQADFKQAESVLNENIAKLVLLGRYGNGSARKAKLTGEGYDYNKIQSIVNQMAKGVYKPAVIQNHNRVSSKEEVAKLVMEGKYGDGDTRTSRLKAEGYNPSEIQKIINHKNLSKANNENVLPSPNLNTTNSNVASKTITMNASAYSMNEKGMGNITANGTNLKVNPRVVAVDPSVIPLGAKVEIEGLGTYLAADTGGAIKGNKIDIHFQTVQECINFGRQNVKVTVYN